ncbi:MAG: VOC family protein [Aggregatilineaceae bacterium]
MAGIRHITALANDLQANIAFYQGVLGQRLIKRTVNFDDPASHRLYYGDAVGSPWHDLDLFSLAGPAAQIMSKKDAPRALPLTSAPQQFSCIPPFPRGIIEFLAG